MPDKLDDEIYPHNDDTVTAKPVVFRQNPTTGADETITLTGRADGVAFLSLTEDIATATALSGCSIALTEVGSTGVYTGVMEGSNKQTALGATADGTVIYRHFQFGSDYRRVKSVIFRKSRRA